MNQKEKRKRDTLRSNIGVRSVKDLLRVGNAKIEWLVDGLIPARSITMIGGRPESYKTWTLLCLAKSISEGQPLFGNFSTQQHKVLLVDEEDSAEYLGLRVKGLGFNRHDRKNNFLVQSNFKVEDEYAMEKLIKFILIEKIGVVMFDSFVRIHSQDENSSSGSALVFQELRKLTKHGCTVILTHHFRKSFSYGGNESDESNNGDLLRGSSDILASLDALIQLGVKRNRIKVSHSKLRVAQKITPFEVEIIERDKKIDFVYKGKSYNASVDLVDEFLAFVRGEDKCSRKQALSFFEDRSIGVNATDDLLKLLVKDEKLIKTKGDQNQDIYTLIN